MSHHITDVLIIGAGPSGAVAAAIIEKSGLDLIVVEKKKFPRFVIGESLLPVSMESLKVAGFMDALEKENFQVKIGAAFVRNEEKCLFRFEEQFTKGWTWTWQVPRERFDNVLTEELERRGVDIWFEHGVTDVKFSGSNSTTTVVDNEGKESTIQAKFIIDASGYGRVLPRILNLVKTTDLPVRQSFFTRIKDDLAPKELEERQATFVILNDRNCWMWIIPFSNGITSVGFVGDTDFFDGNDEAAMREMIEQVPQVRDRFRDMEHVMPPQTIKGYSSGVTQIHGEGFALAGNSAEFLDPVFSSGVAIGVLTGHKAADLVVRQLNNEDVDWENEFSKHIEEGVDTFRSYVKHWYDGAMQDVFFSPTNVQKVKDQICSVLAGYVWDKANPYVAKHKKAIPILQKIIHLYSK